MQCPDVCIITLNRNGKDDMIECAESLKKVTSRNFHILVVENGSADGPVVALKAKYPDVTIIENRRNLGKVYRALIHPQYAIRFGRNCLKKLLKGLATRHEVLYILEMPLSPPSILSNVCTVSIESAVSLIEFARLREIEEPDWGGGYFRELKERFSRGDLCFAVFSNGNIVSVAFVTFGQVYLREVDYYLTFPKKVCALFDSYTLAHYRRLGYYKAVQNSLLSHMAALGFEAVYLWVSASNKTAFEVHNSLGFKNIVQEIILDQRLGLKHRVVRECNISVDKFLNDRLDQS